MREQVEKIIAELKSRHRDRRMHVFDVSVDAEEEGAVKLGGRVLEAANLALLREASGGGGARVDVSNVRVLRRETPVMRTVATNLTNLHAEPSFLSELLTQVTNGDVLEVLEEKDRWSFVRQPDGYLGWAYKQYLVDSPSLSPTHLLHHTAALFSEPVNRDLHDPRIISRLVIGTRVRVVETRERWSRVQPQGAMMPGAWVNDLTMRDLNLLPLPPAKARRELHWDARALTGVPYLWGGCTDFGIDCSGLAQLAHKLVGYTIPRDADLQFEAGKPIEPPFVVGDLLFFSSGGEGDRRNKITHVGISTGEGWNMIHSSRFHNGVQEDDVQQREHLRTTFVGARAFIDRP